MQDIPRKLVLLVCSFGALVVGAGCTGNVQSQEGEKLLPDDYREADKLSLYGTPMSQDSETCGPEKLTFGEAKAALQNRKVRCMKYQHGGTSHTLTFELQADLTTGACDAHEPPSPSSSGPPTGAIVSSRVNLRGMVAVRSADGAFDFRVPSKVSCSTFEGRAGTLRCDLFTDVPEGQNRGTYRVEGVDLDVSWRGELTRGSLSILALVKDGGETISVEECK